MGSFDDVQLCLQYSTLVLHLLMVDSGRCLIELDDHVDRGAVMAAFESIKVFGQLMFLAVGKGQSGGQNVIRAKSTSRAPQVVVVFRMLPSEDGCVSAAKAMDWAP